MRLANPPAPALALVSQTSSRNQGNGQDFKTARQHAECSRSASTIARMRRGIEIKDENADFHPPNQHDAILVSLNTTTRRVLPSVPGPQIRGGPTHRPSQVSTGADACSRGTSCQLRFLNYGSLQQHVKGRVDFRSIHTTSRRNDYCTRHICS